jgi:hypothetical protein
MDDVERDVRVAVRHLPERLPAIGAGVLVGVREVVRDALDLPTESPREFLDGYPVLARVLARVASQRAISS